MIRKTGAVTEELSIFYHPKNKKHLGLARVIFDSVKSARMAVDKLNEISVMGRVIQVFLDPFGMYQFIRSLFPLFGKMQLKGVYINIEWKVKGLCCN